MSKLVYKLGNGPKSKNWDRVIIRVAFWKWEEKGYPRSTYDVQNEIIGKALNGKYRKGNVVIKGTL